MFIIMVQKIDSGLQLKQLRRNTIKLFLLLLLLLLSLLPMVAVFIVFTDCHTAFVGYLKVPYWLDPS